MTWKEDGVVAANGRGRGLVACFSHGQQTTRGNGSSAGPGHAENVTYVKVFSQKRTGAKESRPGTSAGGSTLPMVLHDASHK